MSAIKLTFLVLISFVCFCFFNPVVSATGEDAKGMATRDVYFAGGCFWGVEEYFSRIPGVVDAVSGYAQSTLPNPSYQDVCAGRGGGAETVKVVYDPARVSLATLARQFFKIIDPVSVNRQGNDAGIQYRSGIYYVNPDDGAVLEEIMAAEREKLTAPMATTLEPLQNFYPAEEYHQDYLKKNPRGYCHVRFDSLDDLKTGSEEMNPAITPEQRRVTRANGTERPFSHPYWNLDKPGIYVDIYDGRPLFSSSDKFVSGCGWPSFTAPIDKDAIVEKPDFSHGMNRVETRSSGSDAHLGHVFDDGPNGSLRYCINGAALRFVPLEEMEKAGYGDLINRVKK